MELWEGILAGGLASVALSGLVRTMPKPAKLNDNVVYTWFYDYLQYVLANTDLSGLGKKNAPSA